VYLSNTSKAYQYETNKNNRQQTKTRADQFRLAYEDSKNGYRKQSHDLVLLRCLGSYTWGNLFLLNLKSTNQNQNENRTT